MTKMRSEAYQRPILKARAQAAGGSEPKTVEAEPKIEESQPKLLAAPVEAFLLINESVEFSPRIGGVIALVTTATTVCRGLHSFPFSAESLAVMP